MAKDTQSEQLADFLEDHKILAGPKSSQDFFLSAAHFDLQRFVRPWRAAPFVSHGQASGQTPPESEIPMDIFRDDEWLPRVDWEQELLVRILREPIFRRLALCYQLGTTPIGLHNSASHTRLSHAMGSFEIARIMLRRLSLRKRIPAAAKHAVLIAVFSSHGAAPPFTHALDLTKDVLLPSDHENQLRGRSYKLNRARFSQLIDLYQSGTHEEPLLEALDRIFTDCPPHTRELFMWLVAPPRAAEPMLYTRKFGFLRAFLDGDFAADRLDYLRRDSLMLGEPDFNALVQVVASSVTWKSSGLALDKAQYDLARRSHPAAAELPVNPDNGVELLVGQRDTLYRAYYESEFKLALDEMLAHAVRYYLQDCGLEALRKEGNPEWLEFQRDFFLLSDTQLLDFLLVGRQPASARMATDALTGRSHIPMRVPLASYTNTELDNLLAGLAPRFLELLHSYRGSRQKDDLYPDLSQQELDSIGAALLQGVAPEVVFQLFVVKARPLITEKYRVEDALWSRLMGNKEPAFLQKWKGLLERRYGIVAPAWDTPGSPRKEEAERLLRHLDDLQARPQLFINLPFFSARQVELRKHQDIVPGGYLSLVLPRECEDANVFQVLYEVLVEKGSWVVDAITRLEESRRDAQRASKRAGPSANNA